MDNVTDISEFRKRQEEDKSHECWNVICPHCMHPWVAVFPARKEGEAVELECPACRQFSFLPGAKFVLLLKKTNGPWKAFHE